MNSLEEGDMEYVVRRLPTDIRSLLKEYEGRLYIAGGYIRAVIAGEKPSDIDIFGADKVLLAEAAARLAEKRGENTRVTKRRTPSPSFRWAGSQSNSSRAGPLFSRRNAPHHSISRSASR